MALQELLKVHSVKHVEQKAFDGGVSHRGFPGCVDCRGRRHSPWHGSHPLPWGTVRAVVAFGALHREGLPARFALRQPLFYQ